MNAEGSPNQVESEGLSRLKLPLLCFIAVSPSLGTAVAALGRLLLYLWGLSALITSLSEKKENRTWRVNKPVTIIILIACGYFALSTAWSQVDGQSAWTAWSRYARLITIPLMYYLIKNNKDGISVLRAFTGTQVFVCLSSWLLVFGIHPPWISAISPDETYASFGTYLEESIAQSVMVGILWFKRSTIFGPKGKPLALFAISCSVSLVLLFLNGRTGHLCMLGIIALACLRGLPAKKRLLALLAPVLAAGVLWVTSPSFQSRSATTYQELIKFRNTKTIDTSIGTRLHFWLISLKGIAAHPIEGVGAGSWKIEYQHQTESSIAGNQGSISNSIQGADDPHQLFMLWGVEGGLIGLALLAVTLTILSRQSRHLNDEDAWVLRAMVMTLVISSLFNSILHGIGMGDFFCVGIGIILSLGIDNDAKVQIPKNT